ncbi:MAG: transporter substrate-binding domain-containing protein [Lachnospiraceae bacterium]|nr:transporter substrate-binding domain-containing protein [Lachnospiraceae bacterium]
MSKLISHITIRRLLYCMTALWMLVLSILVCSRAAYGATDNSLKAVSVAYFYDKDYFGDKYDSADKEGFGYKYLQAIGNFSGWEYRYVYGDYDTLLEQFMLGRIDLMPAMPRDFDQDAFYEKLISEAKNEEARRNIEKSRISVLYPNQPMNTVDYYLCIPKNMNDDSFSILSLAGKRIAVPSQIYSYTDEWLRKLGLKCEIIEYDNDAACINAVNRGDAEAAIGETGMAESGLVIGRKVGSMDFYLGVSSNSRYLLKDVNYALETIGAATDGFLQILTSSFNSSGKLDKNISLGERQWLTEHKTLKMGVLSDFQPFCSINAETGETSGFIYEAISDILFNVGADIDIKYTHYASYRDLLSALESGEVDVVFPVTTYLSQSETNNYIFTQNIAESNVMLVYKGEFSEGLFATVAYPKDSIEEYYDVVNYSSSALYEYDTPYDCIDAVLDEEVNCTIVRDNITESYIRDTSKNTKLNVIPLPEKLKMGLGVKRGNVQLYTLISRAVSLTLQGRELTDLALNSSSRAEESRKGGILSYLKSGTLIFLIITAVLTVVCIILASILSRTIRTNREMKRANSEIKGVAKLQQQNFDIISILTRDYSSVFKINLETDDMEVYRIDSFAAEPKYASMLSRGAKYTDFFNQYVRDFVFEDDKPKMYDEIGVSVIRQKLKQRNSYAVRFRRLMEKGSPRYYEFRVSTVDIDITGKVQNVIIAFIDCNAEILHELEYMKGLEKALKSDAVITGLTGDFDWVAYVANVDGKDSNESGVTHYRIGEMFKERLDHWEDESNFAHMTSMMADKLVLPEDRKNFLYNMGKAHIRKHLLKDLAYFINFRVSKSTGPEYYQIKCVADFADGQLFGFILGFHCVDDEIRKEKEQQVKLERMVADRTAELEEKNESLNRMNNDIIELMGNVVEGRDEESGQHVRRVMDFTHILASQVMRDYPEYGLTPELVKVITSASALHDVGKIMISDSILLKPGRLTNEEYEIMKTHTVRGTEILKKMPADWDKTYLKISMEICRHHHEKFDGKGYPDMLKGDDIPISAQIVSVADCYDALVSKRVYKDAYSCEEAYNMIEHGECGAFNPKIMEAFTNCKHLFEDQVRRRNAHL